MKQFFSLLTVLALLAFLPDMVLADNYARDYIAAPPGTKALALYYNHTTDSDYYHDGKKTCCDFNFKGNVGILRGIYFTEAGGFTINPQILLPFGDIHLDGKDAGGAFASNGLADPTIASGIWLINKPEKQMWLAPALFVTAPLGEYDNDKALNIGNNRWAFKGELGFVKGFGKFYVDLTGNVEFYTDNDDFGRLSMTLEKDPLFTFETHFSYDLTDAFFVSGDYYYHNGGETTIAGIAQDDEEDDHSVGLSLGYSFTPAYQLLVQTRHDVEVENGMKEHIFGLRFFHFF
jgi:hypothetical protein